VLTLSKADGAAEMTGISKLEIGASWDTTGGGNSGVFGKLMRSIGTDLDLVGIIMNRDGEPVRFAGIDQLDPLGDGSILHSGDNQTGKGSGDDETITLHLDKISGNVQSVVLVATAFKRGSSLDRAANVSFKVYDSSNGSKDQVADIWPSLLSKDNACAVAKAYRGESGWELTVLNIMGKVAQGDRQSLMRFGMGK
jgi:stress response protein SCP2